MQFVWQLKPKVHDNVLECFPKSDEEPEEWSMLPVFPMGR